MTLTLTLPLNEVKDRLGSLAYAFFMYDFGKEELAAVAKLFEKKKLFRYQGPGVPTECSSFETEFSTYLGTNHSLLLTSGTNALVLALKVLGVGPGDEVIIPCCTSVATPAAVLTVGAKPIVANIDEHLALSVEDLQKKITPQTKAIIPVHMDGLNCQMDAILKLAREHHLYVIEDVAQAVGGSFKGKKLGTFGDAGCFSFNQDKIISCGEGGALTLSSEAHFKKALQLHDVPVRYGETFKSYMASESHEVGFSMRVSEISGVILREQLKKLNSILLRLQERKKAWETTLSAADVVRAHDPLGDCGSSLHLSVGDPLGVTEFTKKLLKIGIPAMPVAARPAHSFWQWADLLQLDEETKRRTQFDLASSKLRLSTTLKVFIQTDLTLEETDRLAKLAAEELS